MTIYQFFQYVEHKFNSMRDWRYGQSLMNCLYELNSELYQKVKDKDYDVYYSDSFKEISDCKKFIAANWVN